MTVVSTELIDHSAMTSAQVTQFANLLKAQGIPELTLRVNAMNEWSSGQVGASTLSKAKEIIAALTARGIAANVDLHTWYTTWDNSFRDEASNAASNRAKYLTYVRNAVNAFAGQPIHAFMVLNEPQATTASNAENQFIRDCVAVAQDATAQPVSVRFMCGYSPSTGHYAADIDQRTDFMCRNTYWDPRSPGAAVYGTTEAKMDAVIRRANELGVELWITEFGKSKSNQEAQRAYVAAFVAYAKDEDIDRIYCWVSQPVGGSGESYNIFNGMSPLPAFYELDGDAAPPVEPPPVEPPPVEPPPVVPPPVTPPPPIPPPVPTSTPQNLQYIKLLIGGTVIYILAESALN